MKQSVGGNPGSTSLRSPEPVPVSAHAGNDPGRIDCPFNPDTQLAEYLAWLSGFTAGANAASDIWRAGFASQGIEENTI